MTIEIGTTLNHRNGKSITTSMSNAEAAALVAEKLTEDDWLAFWIHSEANKLSRGGALPNVVKVLNLAFLYAVGRGLKRPRIRVAYEDIRYHFFLSRRGTVCLKAADRRVAGQNLWCAEDYIGNFYRGDFLDSYHTKTAHYNFVDTLANQENVARFLAQCSKDLGSCCYCNKPLSDDNSKAVGYGKVCASRWGLPWGGEYDEKAPTMFSVAMNRHIQEIASMVLTNPSDLDSWNVLSDLIEEQGLPRMEYPGVGAQLPAAI